MLQRMAALHFVLNVTNNMIRVVYNGRLGNNMFQYALGRIIAEMKGYTLIAEPLPMFKTTSQHVEGTYNDTNILYVTNKNYIDFELIRQHNGGIVLAVWGQNYSYYESHIDKIKNWFNISDSEQSFAKPEEDALVIHLRLEDYVSEGIVLDPKAIITQAQKLKCNRGYIVTNDITHPQVEYFKKCGFKLFHNSLLNDFIFLKNAKNLIISQSSYSWWAGVLGSGNVYVPWLNVNNKSSHWPVNPGPDDINLKINNNRFFYFN